MPDPIFESVTTMDQPEFARWVASREARDDARYELPSGDTLEPDASFVSTARWEASPPSLGRFLRVVPDLVAEILSPSTAARDRGD